MLTEDGPVSLRGYVDAADTDHGVRGWVLDLDRPDEPVLLELLFGDVPVAEVVADRPREDIADLLGEPVTPGFGFDPDLLAGLSSLVLDPTAPVSVRVSGTEYHLPAASDLPSAQDLFPGGTALGVADVPSPDDLPVRLEQLRGEAAGLAGGALRPSPQGLFGFVETVAVDPAGLVWFVGWMREDTPLDFAAAVAAEGQKYACGCAIAPFGRPDLPKGAHGVVGVLATEWRPRPDQRAFTVFFGSGASRHLKTHTPLRIIRLNDFALEFEHFTERMPADGRGEALRRLLTSVESWTPSPDVARGLATEASVDRVLLVPGLGSLVEGWLLSPLRRVEGLKLRVGGSVMTAGADTLFWKPREDLLRGYPGSEAMLARAGFVGLFSGVGDPEDFSEPMLKILFEGGTSVNLPVPPKVFRRLGHSAALDDAQRFFPALQDEPFFPRFAEAAIRAQRRGMAPPVVLSMHRHPRVMVFVLPEDRCDLFLLFEELGQQCRRRGGLPASIVLVASARANRADALWLFREFERTHGVSASLLVIEDASHAFAHLPEILRRLGATRFFFAGPGVLPTDEGWALAHEAVASESLDLVLFGLKSDRPDLDEGMTDASARCFAWATAPFLRWAEEAPQFLGGFYRDNGLARASRIHAVRPGLASLSRSTLPTKLQDAVNAAVYATGAAR